MITRAEHVMVIVVAAFVRSANGVNGVIRRYLSDTLAPLLFGNHVNELKLIHVMLMNVAILNMLTLWSVRLLRSAMMSK